MEFWDKVKTCQSLPRAKNENQVRVFCENIVGGAGFGMIQAISALK